jgi:hypothetical protein
MNGYLQRIALSAIKPGESIQPVLGSVFSPAKVATDTEALPIENVELITGVRPSEFVPRGGLPPSLDECGTGTLPGIAPATENLESAGSIKNPSPTSHRLFSPLLPGSDLKPEPLRTSRKATVGASPGNIPGAQEEAIALGGTVGRQDFRNGAESKSSQFESNANEKMSTGPRRSEAVEHAPCADPALSFGRPSAGAFQAPKPGSERRQPAVSIGNPILISSRLPAPLLSGGTKAPQTFTAPSLPEGNGDQQERRLLRREREATAGAPPNQNVDRRAVEPTAREPIEATGAPPKQKVDREGVEMTAWETIATAEAWPKQMLDGKGLEMAPGKTPASQDLRRVLGSTSSSLTFGADEMKRMGSRPAWPSKREPDEIQIRIGRIEVVAVPPAAASPAPVKPRRATLSLEEYLRRRDGRGL